MIVLKRLTYPRRLILSHGSWEETIRGLLPSGRVVILYGQSQSARMTLRTGSAFQKLLYPGGEPTWSLITELTQEVPEIPEAVLAVGGGSVLDSAKMLAARLYHRRHGLNPEEILEPGGIRGTIPLFAVPSTAGTGSEVTPFGTVSLKTPRGIEKRLLTSDHFVPQLAVLDGRLTDDLPVPIARNTGIDAFTHALEAYLSRKASFWSDPLALQALATIHHLLPEVLNNEGLETSRDRLLEASSMAGMAFAQSSVGLVHGMSRPLGVWFHLPHGYANAVLLPWVMAFTLRKVPPMRLRNVAYALGLDADVDGVEAIVEHIRQWLHGMGVQPWPISTAESRTLYENAPRMAAQALASGSPANNPVVPTAEEIVRIYRDLAQSS